MIKLHFPSVARYDRAMEPSCVAVPLPKGALKDEKLCWIGDGQRALPAQFSVTGRWEDGSVRWLLSAFEADLPGIREADVWLHTDGERRCEGAGMTVSPTLVDTGKVRLHLPKGKGRIFERAETPWGTFEGEELGSFEIEDGNGSCFFAGTGAEGWQVLESGPVRAMLRTRGVHEGAGGGYFHYELTLTAWLGKEYVEIAYRIINREKKEKSAIARMELPVRLKGSEGEKKFFTLQSCHFSYYKNGEGDGCVEQVIDGELLKYQANEHNPEVFYGTLCAGWHDAKRGICATIYQAQQNMPKAVKACGSGLTVGLIPAKTGEETFARGMAKTHRVLLHFHAPDADIRHEVVFRSLQYQLPDMPVIDGEVYEQSGVFESFLLEKGKRLPEVERYFYRIFSQRAYAYGIQHWGDNPDEHYTSQGRGKGETVWINSEYDAPHAFYLYYLHCGWRMAYGAFKCSAEHLIDIDVCHDTDNRKNLGAQMMHSAGHVTLGSTPSHEWVEGMFDYYHATGDPIALETALGVGENVAYQLDHILEQTGEDYASAREAGWALRTLVCLYRETHQTRWLDYCRRITDYFFQWERDYGAWLSVYTEHTVVRVTFMIAVAINALKQYHDVSPDPQLAAMLIRAADDMLAHCFLPELEMPIYKSLPSLMRPFSEGLELASLAYAYQLSGDIKYLRAGLPCFRQVVGRMGAMAPTTKELGYHLLVSGYGQPSNKSFAMPFPAVVVFYKCAAEAGLL